METKLYLPIDYIPSCHDVLIGRGKKCYHHEGNDKLRAYVKSHLMKYSSITSTKSEKSKMLCTLIAFIRQKGGCFIRQESGSGNDSVEGRFYDVGDFVAKEKISQTFRDAMPTNSTYRSSTAYKKKKRRQQNKNKNDTAVTTEKSKDTITAEITTSSDRSDETRMALGRIAKRNLNAYNSNGNNEVINPANKRIRIEQQQQQQHIPQHLWDLALHGGTRGANHRYSNNKNVSSPASLMNMNLPSDISSSLSSSSLVHNDSYWKNYRHQVEPARTITEAGNNNFYSNIIINNNNNIAGINNEQLQLEEIDLTGLFETNKQQSVHDNDNEQSWLVLDYDNYFDDDDNIHLQKEKLSFEKQRQPPKGAVEEFKFNLPATNIKSARTA